MKPVFAIPLFLLAQPIVAAEMPMSYARFTTPDPLALSYPFLSPYAYCANNPVCNVDLDGRKVKPVEDAEFQIPTLLIRY